MSTPRDWSEQSNLVFDWLIFFYLVTGTGHMNGTHEGINKISWDKLQGLVPPIEFVGQVAAATRFFDKIG